MGAAVLASARIAVEELARGGWQDASSAAWDTWDTGGQYDPPAGVDRFTAALVSAANWEQQNHVHRPDGALPAFGRR